MVFCCIPGIHEHPIWLLCCKENRHLNITVHFNLFKKTHLGIVYTFCISLTCILCKVVLYYVWKHRNANNVIFHHQHGFQIGFSCQTQLVEVVHDWVSSTYNHKQTCTLLLDFSKAFDIVSHKCLLNILNYYDITGPTKQRIKSFMFCQTAHRLF